MYVQITTRCNMRCAHCCYSCTSQGEDMGITTYRKAVALDDSISIGGGEPTIHPRFWEMLMYAVGECDYVWLATNGKKTRTALALAKLAQKGVVAVDLSLDAFHEPIHQCVIDAFTPPPRPTHYVSRGQSTDLRAIRCTSDANPGIIKAGRCTTGVDGCVCPDWVAKPNGDIYACGCADSPKMGTVDNFSPPDDWISGECWKDQERLSGQNGG